MLGGSLSDRLGFCECEFKGFVFELRGYGRELLLWDGLFDGEGCCVGHGSETLLDLRLIGELFVWRDRRLESSEFIVPS